MINKISVYWKDTRARIIGKGAKSVSWSGRERLGTILQFAIGLIYVMLGVFMLCKKERANLLIERGLAQDIVIGTELLVLGVYALLHVTITLSEHSRCKLVKMIQSVAVTLIMPYYVCIDGLKRLMKDTRQEHVAFFLPFYLVSLLVVAITFVCGLKVLAEWKFVYSYIEMATLIMVLLLVIEFLALGKGFVRLFWKWVTRSERLDMINAVNKQNSNGVKINDEWEEMLKDKGRYEWKYIKDELEYTKIYIYIMLVIMVLCIPKDNILLELMSNQLLGITTIAALGREVKGKMKGE